MPLSTALGSRLKRWLLDYASDGTWTCELGSGNTDQPTAGQRPSVDTLTSGQTFPLFDDSDDCLDINRISTSVIPTWASTQRFLFCCLMKANSGQAQGWILGLDTHSNFISGVSGKVNFADASSNDDLRDDEWHTVIVYKNGTGPLTIVIDNVAQTDTGTANWGNDWRTSLDWRLGARQDDSLPFGGGLASMAWAFSEDTDFDSTDIANVHDALVEIRDGGGGGAQTASPGGVATAYASGTAKINLTASPIAIASAYASGAAQANQQVAGTGIASAYASGAAQVNQQVTGTGIPSAYESGTTKTVLFVVGSGITTGYASGDAALSSGAAPVLPGAIATTFASGNAALGLHVAATAISSAFGAGAVTLSPGTVQVSPGGVASAFASGEPGLFQVDAILPDGIPSAGVSGAPAVLPGGVTAAPQGVASAEAFGAARTRLYAIPAGVASGYASGVGMLALGVALEGIASGYASGTGRLLVRVLTPAITSAETFGDVRLGLYLAPTAIAPTTAMGQAVVQLAGQSINCSGIIASAAFGVPALTAGVATLHPTGMPSAYASGTVIILTGGLVRPGGVASANAFGSAITAKWAHPFIYTSEALVPGPVLPSTMVE